MKLTYAKRLRFFGVALFLSIPLISQSQTPPQIWLTWRASTYQPPAYTGHSLPTGNSTVQVSVMVIRNGASVDLRGQEVYWYQEEDLIAGGRGLQTVSIRVPEVYSGIINIRVELPGLGEGGVKTIEIPILAPVAIIRSPYPNDSFSESKILLRAIPYNFNVSNPKDLTYSWRINGKPPTIKEFPDRLELSVEPGTPSNFGVNLALAIQNPRHTFENVSKSLRLIFRNQ